MINNVVLQGRIVFDLELKKSSNGTYYINSRMATKLTKEKSLFMDFKVFGKQAEILDEMSGKGKLIAVTGRLDLDEYEDKSGNQVSKIVLIANQIDLLEYNDKAKDDEEEEPKTSRGRSGGGRGRGKL